jgi:hypothetical protein
MKTCCCSVPYTNPDYCKRCRANPLDDVGGFVDLPSLTTTQGMDYTKETQSEPFPEDPCGCLCHTAGGTQCRLCDCRWGYVNVS